MSAPRPRPAPRDIAVTLADETVPLRVIARALSVDFATVETWLRAAIDGGRLARMPPADRPPAGAGAVPRLVESAASSAALRLGAATDVAVDGPRVGRAMVLFGLTRQQAHFLVAVALRDQAPYAWLRKSVAPNANSADMIRVLAMSVRKRLAAHRARPAAPRIETVYGYGFCIEPEGRAALLAVLDAPAVAGVPVGAGVAVAAGVEAEARACG